MLRALCETTINLERVAGEADRASRRARERLAAIETTLGSNDE